MKTIKTLMKMLTCLVKCPYSEERLKHTNLKVNPHGANIHVHQANKLKQLTNMSVTCF